MTYIVTKKTFLQWKTKGGNSHLFYNMDVKKLASES